MVTQIENYDQVDVFVGLDVGKGEHHAVALDRTGNKLYDRPLPNDERRLRAVLADLQRHSVVLLIVDQPATIGALPVAVAQAAGALVGYLPGLAMRRIADPHPGEAKTDARDAAIIAETARSMPHTLRSTHVTDEQVAELTMLCGFDDDLAAQITQVGNRVRGLLTQIHPALERAVGPRLDHPAILDLLQRCPSPADMRAAGEKRIATRMLKLAPRKGRDWAHEIVTALGEQTVIVTGTNAAAMVLPRLPRLASPRLASPRSAARNAADAARRGRSGGREAGRCAPSSPGLDEHARSRRQDHGQTPHRSRRQHFPTAGHLAAYAGLAPVTRRSGTSIRGEYSSRRENKVLKNAMFLSAFAALRDPESRAYYDRKVGQGTRHNQALLALARRRCDVLYAMLRDGTLYSVRRG